LNFGYIFASGPSFKPGPFRRDFGLRPLSIKDIIHNREEPPRNHVSGDKPHDYPMGEGSSMAPGTDLHAYTAIRTNLSPVGKTCLIVQLPSEGPINLRKIFQGNGIGRAADGALLTNATKIFGPDIYGFVGYEGKICGHGA
jgi:hypothetical protein